MNCFCGYGVYKRGDRYVIRSHDMDCLWLSWMITLEKDGVCGGCGERLDIRQGRGWKETRCRTCEYSKSEMWH